MEDNGMSLKTEFVMELIVKLGQPYVIGDVPKGFRRVIPITGGTFKGPELEGIVLPGGADWNLKRPDGTGELWARYIIQVSDGTLISVLNRGSIFPTEEARTTPSFEVAGEKYNWLNYSTFIGTKKRHPEGGVHLHFYLVK